MAKYSEIFARSKKYSIPYGASVTPQVVPDIIAEVGTLTGNITVANPTGPVAPKIGDRLHFHFTADDTGRQITYGNAYRAGVVPASSAAQRARQSFSWDGEAWVAIAPLVWFAE